MPCSYCPILHTLHMYQVSHRSLALRHNLDNFPNYHRTHRIGHRLDERRSSSVEAFHRSPCRGNRRHHRPRRSRSVCHVVMYRSQGMYCCLLRISHTHRISADSTCRRSRGSSLNCRRRPRRRLEPEARTGCHHNLSMSFRRRHTLCMHPAASYCWECCRNLCSSHHFRRIHRTDPDFSRYSVCHHSRRRSYSTLCIRHRSPAAPSLLSHRGNRDTTNPNRHKHRTCPP